ncbi:nuclear segregation protein [Grosmannia clavigera kw1407]|uniref:Nuclear segregation protein n=1 Tax=Grosmannia clavigera (strain kw1407 / UAMH 11150) TaxID=655863 RepID=F0XI35_GROCL|nr:nuclear segregation protein [Grosmannia clavigera kw1407]EFX02790.1 nuclear segregation protein [Grosmannia clavigera kw1407]
MADSTAPVVEGAAAAGSSRPVKPDEAVFQKALDKAEKEHKDVMTRFNAIKAKIELAQPNKSKDGPQSATQKRRQELIEQLTEIRKKQAGGKSARTSKQEQIKRLDEQLRSRIAEQKTAKSKVAFKSTEDLDRHIQRLEDQVNGGMMKLVDEKKALSEITSLKKTRKNFAQFDVQEKQIADLRANIKQIKDSMDDPEAKAMGEKYNAIQAELDGIKAEQDVAYKSLSALRDERSKLHAEQRDKFDAIRKLKDDYYGQKKAFAAYEREARQKAWERKQAERERFERERKKERAQRLLAEASDPAYIDEIRRARSLLHFFDPTSTPAPAPAAVATAAASLGAQATRKVDDSGLKGTRLVRKEDRDDTYLPAAKKGAKKSAKKSAADSASKGYNVPPSVIEDCASMGLDPPASQADVAVVMEKVKAKLAHWEADQETQTQRNIEKAKKEIERIEKEEAQEIAKANGKQADEPKAVAEVTAELKNASIEDKAEEKKDEADKEETKA